MNYTDIKNLVYLYTGTNSVSLSDANMVLYVNRALEQVIAKINKEDARWEFDDTNQSDLPIATTTITSGQADYSLSTSHLSINRIEVKDESGNWHLLRPIDRTTIRHQALDEYRKTNGLPKEYDKLGNSFFLYPTPDFTQAASIKVYFTRGPVLFASDDTTAEPGFNTLFHELLPLKAALQYGIGNGKKNIRGIRDEITILERDLEAFYGMRNRDEIRRMTPGTNPASSSSFGAQSGTIGFGGGDSNK